MLFGAEHVKAYEESNGEVGYDFGDHGAKILILSTTGRKSGEERKNALIYRDVENGARAIVASNGGDDKPPLWLLNLQADPSVHAQVKADRYPAHARVASDEEQARIWPQMTEIWPDYDEYTKKTDRKIHVVLLERA